jgi:amidase
VPGESSGCRSREEFREKLRTAVVTLMDEQRLDALVYPTWSNPPRLIGDLNTRPATITSCSRRAPASRP